jgi:hypothetical protein
VEVTVTTPEGTSYTSPEDLYSYEGPEVKGSLGNEEAPSTTSPEGQPPTAGMPVWWNKFFSRPRVVIVDPSLGKARKLKLTTEARRLAYELRACKKKPKSRRAACMRRAKKKYGSAARKSKRG